MARTKKTSAEATTATADALVTYKGFNADLTCRGFQYAVGESYRHEGVVEACASGFHGCEHPLGVLGHYAPATSVYAVCEQRGPFAREPSAGDTKVASAEITITARIELPELIARAVSYVFDRAKWIAGPFASGSNEGVKAKTNGGAATASGDGGAATASGDGGAATASGDGGAATASGDGGAATASGWWGAATASGDGGAATASGRWGAATASGWWGAATASGDGGAATASGERGAATASGDGGAATASGRWGAATASGRWGAATASGERGAATASGRWGAATASGRNAIAVASGPGGKARGAAGCDLVLREFDDDGRVVARWIGVVGQDGIKPDTWYTLRGGSPVEVS